MIKNGNYLYIRTGDVAEWSNASVLKTDVPRGTGGSNPSISAIKILRVSSIELLQ